MTYSNKSIENRSEEAFWCARHQRLEIDGSGVLNYPCRIIIYGWKEGLRWYTELESEIYQPPLFSEPGLNLTALADQGALHQWQLTLPVDLLQRLQPFKSWRFSLLQIASQWHEMRDLLRSTPLLAWLVRDFMASQGLTNAQIKELINLRQHQILDAIGLTATKSSVRILRRVKLECYDSAMLRLIRDLWSQPALIARLTHQRKLDRSMLRLLQQLPWVAGRSLANVFDEIDCHWRHQALVRLVGDSCRMSNHNRDIREQLANSKSFNAVETIHNRLADEMNQRPIELMSPLSVLRDEHGQPLPFPEPPHPGTAAIKPILSPRALIEEGERMSHCVASYIRWVQEGEYFVYHIESPQSMTIGVQLRRGNIHRVDQISGVRNQSPDQEIMGLVESWISDLRGSSRRGRS